MGPAVQICPTLTASGSWEFDKHLPLECPSSLAGEAEPRCCVPTLTVLLMIEFADKSAASAAFPDYERFQAVIKSAASAASLRGGCASGRLDNCYFFSQFSAALAAKK